MVVSLNNDGSLAKLERKVYHCPKCKSEFGTRIHRGPLVRTFLFWLPIRRYACYNCKRKYHVWR